ncbi:diguanylate cyclase domain-containing protein [Brevibacterium sediminis]
MRSVFGRSGELTARLGGEEFVVVLPNINASNLARGCWAAVR